MEKRSHLGMAGHYAAMGEFLYRGYNVAVPAVDVGDDVYIVEDGDGTMWRLQVKTSDQIGKGDAPAVCSYGLSRSQLRTAKPNELFYMFLARWQSRWQYLLIGRVELANIRDEHEAADRAGKPGRKPATDKDAKTDTLTLHVKWSEDTADFWGVQHPVNVWHPQFPPIAELG